MDFNINNKYLLYSHNQMYTNKIHLVNSYSNLHNLYKIIVYFSNFYTVRYKADKHLTHLHSHFNICITQIKLTSIYQHNLCKKSLDYYRKYKVNYMVGILIELWQMLCHQNRHTIPRLIDRTHPNRMYNMSMMFGNIHKVDYIINIYLKY